MSLNQIYRLRSLVQQVRKRDARNGGLTALLEPRAQQLHEAIKLPIPATDLLADFVVRYVEQVPDFIEAIADISMRAGIYSQVAPLLDIACNYFLSPPDLIRGQGQLELLLEEAYLAHRLLEEVNDRFIGFCGVPLAPMDMTRANIIAHELIGEPFANELDQAVLFSAELLLSQYSFTGVNFQQYAHVRKNEGWSAELKRWPCLANDIAIAVEFKEPVASLAH